MNILEIAIREVENEQSTEEDPNVEVTKNGNYVVQ